MDQSRYRLKQNPACKPGQANTQETFRCSNTLDKKYFTSRIPKRQNQKPRVFWYEGKVVGKMIGDTLIKSVKSSKHMLQVPKGWAVDFQAIQQLISLNGKKVEIRDKESGTIYQASIEEFRKFGIEINRGCGNQVVLPLERWSIYPVNHSREFQLGF